MKVVILHQHFNTPSTGGGIRSWYLAKALVERGIEVIVITAHNGKSHQKLSVDGIEVHYLPVAYDNKFGFGARSRAFLKYVFQSVRLMDQFRDAEFCYAISVPLTVGLAALWIRKRYRIPYYFEVGDLWPDAPVQMDFIKNYFLTTYLYALEKRIYKKAIAVVALSTAIQSAILKKVPGKKMFLIPNMADCDFYHPEKKDTQLETKFNVHQKFVVSYTGAIGLANGLDYFLECANLGRKHELPIQFILCGAGAVRDRLAEHARKLSLTNISFIDFQDREGIRQILNITDAAFVSYKRVPILETGSPNKFFDGLAAGKLIIVNFGGWIKTEIEDSGCGFYANPNKPEDFITKIKQFIEHPDALIQFQHAARSLAERKYSRTMLSEEFAQLFRK